MNKIQVNPTLFVTCRLCLEDLGQYQIVPEVKELISYCFDILVEPFDGLPQLICKKCEAILSTYSQIKKTFIEKQNGLKRNISQSLIGSVSQVQEQICNENIVNKKVNVNLNKKLEPLISTSSSDTECDKIANGRNKNVTKTSKSWVANYSKLYVCRICNSQWFPKKSLLSHLSKHSYFFHKYRHVFMRHSAVRLNKLDGKPNITGSKYKVMHGRDKIIENINPKYYVIYKSKNSDNANNDALKDNEIRNVKAKHMDSTEDHESSDSSQDNIVFKRKRVRRLCSRSSNETVVLDTPIKCNLSDKESKNSENVSTPANLGECINIDDSSEDETSTLKKLLEKKEEKQVENVQNNIDVKLDHVTIHDVINACRSKYFKKHYQDNLILKEKPSNIASQLKRKVLSLGRKVIHKKLNVNCTPLLRFMDHKNLDITWLPREITLNQDANSIRVMTRIRSNDENCDNETGWTDYIPIQTYGSNTAATPSEDVNSVEFSNSEPNIVPNAIGISIVPSEGPIESTTSENAVLICDASLLSVDTKKLLNSNPVANPKQLPKKTIIKSVVKNTESEISLDNTDKDFCMPIITSTTSLATPFIVEESRNIPETASSKNDNLKSNVPRIKVKPVSELMSAETLNRLQEPVQMPCIVSAGTTDQPMIAQTENNAINLLTTQTDPILYKVTSPQGNVALNLIAPEPAWQNEFMILDTVEMPNTTTNSPFLYFRRLLQLHDIILLGTDVELSKEFNCLIKFKVLYKQDVQNRPVILCLALYCSKNIFCLKVKDRNHENLDLTKISPNWQWEVLKIYKGEVVNKVLFNAQKIGPDVYENTTNFLCLLKSINLIKAS